MPTLVFVEVFGVAGLIGREKLAPKFSTGFFGGSQVHRKARRIVEAFKRAIKVVEYRDCSNFGYIQIVKLVY